jgi:enediyne biosynthesis protein E4
MDLLVVNIGSGVVNYLYHDNGNGMFTRILTNTLATDRWPAGGGGGAWADYDNDGLLDLFITSRGVTQNALYHNLGGGAFAKVASGPMLSLPAGAKGRGCAWGDYDKDGYLDLVVTYADGKHRLFHNNGDGTFTQILSGPPVDDGGPGLSSPTRRAGLITTTMDFLTYSSLPPATLVRSAISSTTTVATPTPGWSTVSER